MLGILGPNGVGKTTLLRATLGLVPYAGDIRVGDQSVGQMSPTARAQLLAYVPQKSQLAAPLRVVDVVAMGRFASPGPATTTDKTAVNKAIGDTDLLGFEDRLFTQLSGGEQRRVLLARALATEAPIVLMDEPTAALDVAHALSLTALLRRLAQAGRTIVVVVHDLYEAAQLCDDVALLKDGRLFGTGDVQSWIAPDPVRQVFGVDLIANGGFAYRLPEGAPNDT